MNRAHTFCCWTLFVVSLALGSGRISAQQPPGEGGEETPSRTVVIPDEPRSIDPSTLVAPQLAAKVQVSFKESSLSDVASYIQQQSGMHVLLDRRSLENANILTSEPVVDRLDDEPLYLLLDRLSSIGVGWRLADDVIHLDAARDAQVFTKQYNVGDLFDDGYYSDTLSNTIQDTVAPDTWEVVGGPGGIVVLGDVMFVRQTSLVHRKVAGLLAALRKHGRRTLVFDPPQHAMLREALRRPLAVTFRGTPLAAVAEQLSNVSKTDIRLDRPALRDAAIRERLPVDLVLEGQSLRVALDVLAQQYGLQWQLKNGVLWLTTSEQVDADCKTAVFDVRDLCRDQDESDALEEAITGQSHPDSWEELGGPGSIEFPVAGTMVVSQTEQVLDDVLQLLENYRTALRASKPRVRPESDPKAVITRYYRMPSNVAEDLLSALPALVRPETWHSDERPDAPGTIQKISSWGEVKAPAASSAPAKAGQAASQGPAWVVSHSVLIIRQMREVHDEIPLILNKIEHGESGSVYAGMGGMGGMGGGFGGGFFSVPPHRTGSRSP